MKMLWLILLTGCTATVTKTEPALTTLEVALLVAAVLTGLIFIKWIMR